MALNAKFGEAFFCAHKANYDIAISFTDDFCNRVIGGFNAAKHFGWNHEDYIAQGLGEVWKAANRASLCQLDGVFCVSETAKKSLMKVMRDKKVPLHVFHNLLNVDECPLAKVSTFQSKEIRLLSVGRICKEKRFGLVIEIASELKRRGVKFLWTIIGEGALRSDLINLAREAGVDESVMFLGAQHRWQQKYTRDVIYVQTSGAEGWGLALEEAALAGYRCVCSDIPVFHEIAHLLNTTFSYCKSTVEFADAIDKLPIADSLPLVDRKTIRRSYDEDKMTFLAACSEF